MLDQGRPTEALYADQVARMLTLRVLETHSTAKAPDSASGDGNGLDAEQLQRVKDYIEAHLHEDIGLDDLAEQADVSEYHLAHQFREAEGQPPYQYVIERRIERAKKLLADTDCSIAQIAFAVGYNSQSSFTTQFRKHTGTTPGAFR